MGSEHFRPISAPVHADGSAQLIPNDAVVFVEGPGNVLIDWAAKACSPELACDTDGKIGSAGSIHVGLLENVMLALPYFGLAAPKTTGRELFSAALFQEWQAKAAAAGTDYTYTCMCMHVILCVYTCDSECACVLRACVRAYLWVCTYILYILIYLPRYIHVYVYTY